MCAARYELNRPTAQTKTKQQRQRASKRSYEVFIVIKDHGFAGCARKQAQTHIWSFFAVELRFRCKIFLATFSVNHHRHTAKCCYLFPFSFQSTSHPHYCSMQMFFRGFGLFIICYSCKILCELFISHSRTVL